MPRLLSDHDLDKHLMFQTAGQLPGGQLQDAEPSFARTRRPRRKLMGWAILAAVVVVIIAIYLLTRLVTSQANNSSTSVATATTSASSRSAQPTAPAAGTSGTQVVDLSSMDQPARKTFVLRLIKQGVFTGVQVSTSPPKVGVTPLFQGLSPDLKQQFLAAVEAYVHNGATTTEPLEIIDAISGKNIGTYTIAEGLKLL
jgi:cytoskeletal protein RodZ